MSGHLAFHSAQPHLYMASIACLASFTSFDLENARLATASSSPGLIKTGASWRAGPWNLITGSSCLNGAVILEASIPGLSEQLRSRLGDNSSMPG